MLYSLNKLNSDSELVVMSAAGDSARPASAPFVALFVLVFLAVSVLYIEIMPSCFDAIQSLTGAHPCRFHRQFRASRRVHRA